MTVSRVVTPRKDSEYLCALTLPLPKCRAIPYEQVLEHAIAAICRPRAVDDELTPARWREEFFDRRDRIQAGYFSDSAHL